MLRFLLWRLLGLLAAIVSLGLALSLLHGGAGARLRGGSSPSHGVSLEIDTATHALAEAIDLAWGWAPIGGVSLAKSALLAAVTLSGCLVVSRWRARRRRCYLRLQLDGHRTDHASAEAVVMLYQSLYQRLLQRWWRRLLLGQPSVALEVHQTVATNEASDSSDDGRAHRAWMAVSCPSGSQQMVEAALRTAYPNCVLHPGGGHVDAVPVVLRLKKSAELIKRAKSLDHFEHERDPPMNRLLTTMQASGESAFVQLALTPAPLFFQRLAKWLYKHHEGRLAEKRRAHLEMRDRSVVEDAELRGGLAVQHRPLFFVDLRVVAGSRIVCERIASELRAEDAENRLTERGTSLRHGLFGIYRRRVLAGEGNPLPSFRRGVFASTELASLWHFPSIDYTTVPFARTALPLAPAPPTILRAQPGLGTLRDAIGAVSIQPELRRLNTAVPGAVDQGKSSYLIATVAEDLRRERCAVIVLDPKGDAADAAVSLVPPDRTCTLLDFSYPTCGFNPLAVDAPADVIADYVVAALKNLFTDADIRASSDRYLRNAIIAVLGYDRQSSLWDAARLLSVGEEGYSYRRSVGTRVRMLPEFKEISEFFTSELAAQLADARSMTTAKLDAPVNKLARLLNSASIKRVLLNDSLRIDFDQVITGAEVLVVKGALGAMGAGNTSVLMQLLIGMLDAALARQQDLVPASQRISVALKVDEAPLVLNRGFAETMALKRSAGLETVACWQADSQWTDREIRDQLDALFAHRVYFATASARDARDSAALTMVEFSDTIRPGTQHLSKLARPDARLYLPKHHAIASWATHAGRQAPFVAQTIPLRVDRERLDLHARQQLQRGGCHRSDLSQPHWNHEHREQGSRPPASAAAGAAELPAEPGSTKVEAMPDVPSDSYRELLELDLAQSVRWAKSMQAPRPLDVDSLDLDFLSLVASFQYVLSSQLHRRFNPRRAVTTTQRRLKRLSDAGLLERFQFHRKDGGGVPMCYVITAAGCELLAGRGRGTIRSNEGTGQWSAGSSMRSRETHWLHQARHEVHVTGWVLALARALGELHTTLRGAQESVLTPPSRSMPGSPGSLTLAGLRMPAGRTPHDFTRTGAEGELVEVERFETVRPDAIVEVQRDVGVPNVDVLVELDDRLPRGRAAVKLERYDHLLAGWSLHLRRYGPRGDAVPVVVFVCRDRARARECARLADVGLRACRAYAGEYPVDWQYPGRERIVFVAERDVHEGSRHGYGVPRLPPSVRVTAAGDDPRAAEAQVELKSIVG